MVATSRAVGSIRASRREGVPSLGEATMSYLYGDSTPSPLEVNFVDFLGDCLDFCAHVLDSTENLRREAEKGEGLRRKARTEAQRLEALASSVAEAVKDVSSTHDSHAANCAIAIVRATSDLVRKEVEQVNALLDGELSKLDALAVSERMSCEKALETLLLRHDLPRTKKILSLKAQANGPYTARVRMSTPFGVAASLDLDVPASHMFGRVIRVDRIIERLEVEAPDVGGWLHKEVKMRPQRLEKLHVIHLEFAIEERSAKLRAGADGSGPGFDIFVRAEGPEVKLARIGDRDAGDVPFDVRDSDATSLLAFLDKLEAPALELLGHRKAVIEATLDDRPLRDHDGPGVLAERLITAVAPVTQEIARRSPSATELVLKRLVAGGRREEIFVTKADLRKKIAHLSPAQRALFDPLGIGEANGAAASHARPAGSAQPSHAEPHVPEPPTLVMAPKRSTGSSEAPRPSSTAPKAPGASGQPDLSVEHHVIDLNSPRAQDDPHRT
jgi:hypothetical protein